MSKYLNALSAGEKALNKRNHNSKEFNDKINAVAKSVEEYTDNLVTLVLEETLIDSFSNVLRSIQKINPKGVIGKDAPKKLALLAKVKEYPSNAVFLTNVELSAEIFPCTIYVEGDQLTAADVHAFDNNLVRLLSSPTVVNHILNLKEESIKSSEPFVLKDGTLMAFDDTVARFETSNYQLPKAFITGNVASIGKSKKTEK